MSNKSDLNVTCSEEEIESSVTSTDNLIKAKMNMYNDKEKSSSEAENNSDNLETDEQEVDVLSPERADLIAELKKNYEDRKYLRWKNSFLNKKVRDFLKKKKFVNYFEKSNIFSNIYTDHRYEAVLNEFEVVKNSLDSWERNLVQVTEESEKLYELRKMEFDKSFQEFRGRFYEIGTEVLKKKDNKLNFVNKKITALIIKMQARMENLKDTRIIFLKLKITLQKINEELSRINILGAGYTVSEYENLSMIKDSNVEIFNKKERKIDSHHNKCLAIINMLSKVKEQSQLLDNDISIFKRKLEEFEEEKNNLQIEFNKLRREKDIKRRKILSLQRKLFTITPELIKEMSSRGVEFAKLRSKLQIINTEENNKISESE